MIENIRKFRIVIILGLALVVLGLVIGMKDDAFRGGLGGQSILQVDGRTYNEREFRRYGPAAMEATQMLGDMMMSYQYLMPLMGGAQDEQSAQENFFVHRMILRKAAEDFGIIPDDDTVSEYIRNMRTFAEDESGFSEEAYSNFIERGIGRLGMTENDFRELISDFLSFEKLREVVGSELTENRDVTARQTALQSQQISGQLGMLSIDDFEEAVKPTDEQLKSYWELQRERYMTPERRKFSYILVGPEPLEEAEEAESTEEGATEDKELSDEEKEKAEEEKAKKAAELAEEKRKRQFQTDQLVEDFSYQLEEQEGADFEKLADEFKWETRRADLFPQDSPPKALDIKLRSTSRGGNAVDELFAMELTPDPLSKISQPIPVGENQWLVARLDEVEEPREKSFEEAREEAKFDYVKEEAAKAMKIAADEAAEKIEAGLKEGKKFTEVAKEAGLEGIKSVEKISAGHQPDPATEPANLFDAGRYTEPGHLSDAIIEDDRAFVFLVEKREVIKQADPQAALDGQVRNTAIRNQYAAFNDWLAAQKEAANVKRLYKQ